MKNISKILATNSVNLIGIFFATLIFCVISGLVHQQLNLFQILFGTVLSILLYGMLFWAIFFVGIFVLDLLIICNSKKNLKQMLILEWLIISTPFIYWIIIYQEWIFLVAVVTFLITQLAREQKIREIKGFI